MFTSIRVAPKGASSTLAVGYFQGQAPDKATLALDTAIAAAAVELLHRESPAIVRIKSTQPFPKGA
jgi:hypothetical protein